MARDRSRERSPRDRRRDRGSRRDREYDGEEVRDGGRDRDGVRDRDVERDRDRGRPHRGRSREPEHSERDRDRRRYRDKDRVRDRERERGRDPTSDREYRKADGDPSKIVDDHPMGTGEGADLPGPPVALSLDGDISPEEIQMMQAMGIPFDFNTTQGQQVDDTASNLGGVKLKQTRRARQYMNRRGGFNRALPSEQTGQTALRD